MCGEKAALWLNIANASYITNEPAPESIFLAGSGFLLYKAHEQTSRIETSHQEKVSSQEPRQACSIPRLGDLLALSY
jgi:hypothetical protein